MGLKKGLHLEVPDLECLSLLAALVSKGAKAYTSKNIVRGMDNLGLEKGKEFHPEMLSMHPTKTLIHPKKTPIPGNNALLKLYSFSRSGRTPRTHKQHI